MLHHDWRRGSESLICFLVIGGDLVVCCPLIGGERECVCVCGRLVLAERVIKKEERERERESVILTIKISWL